MEEALILLKGFLDRGLIFLAFSGGGLPAMPKALSIM